MNDFNLIGYYNSNFDGDKENGVSTSRYLMSLESETISWRPHIPFVLEYSTTKEEHVAVVEATKEIVWFKNILEYL